MRYYAGIGSRKTPSNALRVMFQVAAELSYYDYVLRSGGAEGADDYFERGCIFAGGRKEIYLPWKDFNDNKSELHEIDRQAYEMAREYHPAWDSLSPGGKSMMARNCYQIMGKDLNTPVDFVVCWTENAEKKGGTSQAIRIAEKKGIPVYNIADKSHALALLEHINRIGNKFKKNKNG